MSVKMIFIILSIASVTSGTIESSRRKSSWESVEGVCGRGAGVVPKSGTTSIDNATQQSARFIAQLA